MLINPFAFSGIDAYVKSWMLFNTLDDLIADNTCRAALCLADNL